MAKKRVHEIAKEKGISSKEVLAVLQKAGLDVKAAASSVDEGDIARAFGGGGDASNGGGAAPDAQAQEPPAARDAPPAASRDSAPDAQRPAPQSDGGDGSGRPPRPTRAAPPGRSGGGRHRRVVIDSQASRRPQGPPPQQQPRRRGRGRRRRTPWVEPDLTPQEPVVEEKPINKVQSGATVKEVAESLGLTPP